jgi:hypothetical protein
MVVYDLFCITYIYTGCSVDILVCIKMYKIYFIGKFKIMLIVNEIIFLCDCNIVIQLLGNLDQCDI